MIHAPGRFRIEVNNGLAFGTGKHETTRLCLALLEKWVKPGMTVLDIGQAPEFSPKQHSY